MEEIHILSDYPILQIIFYFVIAIIGGVIYKYWDRWLNFKQDSNAISIGANQKLIENLQARIDNITETVHRLEQEREKFRQNEIERVKELAEAKTTVAALQNRIKDLEASVEAFRDIIRRYQDKYGPI